MKIQLNITKLSQALITVSALSWFSLTLADSKTVNTHANFTLNTELTTQQLSHEPKSTSNKLDEGSVNTPPYIRYFYINQNSKPLGRIISNSATAVIIVSTFDINNDATSVSWSDATTGTSYVLNPKNYNVGDFIKLTATVKEVTEDGTGLSSSRSLLLKIGTAPTEDSNQNDIIDSYETDGSGVKYATHQLYTGNNSPITAPSGSTIKPHIAANGSGKLSIEELKNYVTLIPGGADNTNFDQPLGDIYAYEIEQISIGSINKITIPLSSPIGSNDFIVRYNETSGWRTFDTSSDKFRTSSSANCDQAQWSNDNVLIKNAYCLELTLADGGANDSDNRANGSITNFISVIPVGEPTGEPEAESTSFGGCSYIQRNSSGKSASSNDILLTLLLFLAIYILRKKALNGRNKPH